MSPEQALEVVDLAVVAVEALQEVREILEDMVN